MKSFFIKVGKRLEALILKLLGFEGILFIVATHAMYNKVITDSVWLVLTLGCSGVKTYQAYKGISQDIKISKGDNNG